MVKNYIINVEKAEDGRVTHVTAQWESVQIVFIRKRRSNEVVKVSTVNIHASRQDKDQTWIPQEIYAEIFRQAREAFFSPQPEPQKQTVSPNKPRKPIQLLLFD